MRELKKCPFCSGEAKLLYFGAAQIPFYKITCAECGCTQADSIHKDAVINAWNTRKPMANIAEKLEEEKADSGVKTGYFKGIDKAISIMHQEINNGLE